jgi:predicted dehydrogenase
MGETDLLGCDVRVGQGAYATDLRIQCVSDAARVWDWKPDAVLICTPPSTHYELLNMAHYKCVHVFCEKPLCTRYQEARNSVAMANSSNRVLAIGYQLRFQLDALKAHGWRQNVDFYHGQDMSAWPSQYKKDVLDEFSHEIDAAVYVNGPVMNVSAQDSNGDWLIQLHHVSAVSSICLSPTLNPYARFADTNGMKWEFDLAKNDQAYKDEIKAFLEACRGEGWDERLCRGAEAAHTVRIIEACRESAKDCKVVRL